MPLIVIFILISVIATIFVVMSFWHPQEIADVDKDIEPEEEKISAVTVQAGETYTIDKTGIYKIELHGGKGQGLVVNKSLGNKGSKVTGYLKLNEGDVIYTKTLPGEAGWYDEEGHRWFGNRFSFRRKCAFSSVLCLWWIWIYWGRTSIAY